jgi:hypothetical protein
MNAATTPQLALFEGGPPCKSLTWIGLIRAGRADIPRRALFAVAVGWLPLAILTALQGDFIRADAANSFLLDFGVHARFLIAAPLLILAESTCAPRLAAIARQFVRSGLVSDSDRDRYEGAVSSSRRLMNSGAAEIAAVALAYALIAAIYITKPISEVPGWHGMIQDNYVSVSPAGWWALLVSLPLLLISELGWLWRVCIWTRFLWLMSKLNLRLIPAHPDHAAGLGFVSSSLNAFLALGFIVGITAAGPVMNQIVHHGASPLQFKLLVAGVTAAVVLLFAAPLFVFVRCLHAEQHRGKFEYGALAVRMGQQLEHKWLTPAQDVDEAALEVSDFSATTDLYSVVSNVHAMKIIPLDVRGVAVLVIATWLPFLPLALLVTPFDVILRKVVGLLF